MPASIMAVGTSALNSSDLVVAANSRLTVGLKAAAGPKVNARVVISIKDDAGIYYQIDELSPRTTVKELVAGTYRFERPAGPSCGVFSG